MSYKLELTIADFAFTEYEFNGNQSEVINEILNKKGLDLNYSLKITDVEYNEYDEEESFKNHYFAILIINFDNENELKDFLNQYQDRTEAYIFNIKQEEIIANEVDYSKNTRKFKI